MNPWAYLLKNVTFQFGNRRAGSLFYATNQLGYSGAFSFLIIAVLVLSIVFILWLEYDYLGCFVFCDLMRPAVKTMQPQSISYLSIKPITKLRKH